MKEYRVKREAKKDDFLDNGFTYCGFNLLQSKRYLYKKEIIMVITVDFTESDVGLYTNISYVNGNTYPINNDYGKDLVRNTVIENYEKEMNKLVRKKLICGVKNNGRKTN